MKSKEEILAKHTFVSEHGEVKAMDRWMVSAMQEYADQTKAEVIGKVLDLIKTNRNITFIEKHYQAKLNKFITQIKSL